MLTDSVGSGYGYVSHVGGSVCPEHASNKWDVTKYDHVSGQDVWTRDIGRDSKGRFGTVLFVSTSR